MIKLKCTNANFFLSATPKILN